MSNSIKAITTETAPQPFGHYAQATEAAGVVYVSGQLAARADGTSLAGQPFEVQARQALANIIAIVEGAGLSRDRIATGFGLEPGRRVGELRIADWRLWIGGRSLIYPIPLLSLVLPSPSVL